MEKLCWYRTTLDSSQILDPTWKYPVVDVNKFELQYFFADQIFNPSWLELMESFGLPMLGIMLFYRPANYNTNIAHIDTNKYDHSKVYASALNWVIGGKNSMMHWYDLPDKLPPVKMTKATSTYQSWTISELVEINQVNIDNQVTLVRVDLPHSVSVDNEPRWCFSARFKDCDIITWNSIIDLMKAKNLLIDR